MYRLFTIRQRELFVLAWDEWVRALVDIEDYLEWAIVSPGNQIVGHSENCPEKYLVALRVQLKNNPAVVKRLGT